MKKSLSLGLICAVVGLTTLNAVGDEHRTLFWTGAAGTKKILEANWTNETGDVVSPQTDDYLIFPTEINYGRLVCDRSLTVWGVRFEGSKDLYWNSQSLWLAEGGPGLEHVGTATEFRYENHTKLSGETSFYIESSGNFISFNQNVIGTGKIVKTGAGDLRFAGAPTFSGGVDFSGGGEINLKNADVQLGTGVAKINSVDGSMLTISAANTLATPLEFVSTPDRSTTLVNLPAAAVTLSGDIAVNDGGAFVLSVPAKGSLTLAGDVTWAGETPTRFVLTTAAASASAEMTSDLALPSGSSVVLSGAGPIALANVVIPAAGRVSVESSGAATLAKVTIGTGAKLVIPAGVTLKVTAVNVNGVDQTLGAGVYCAAGGFGDHRCDWIEGEGVICNELPEPPEEPETLVLSQDTTLDFTTHQEYSGIRCAAVEAESAVLSGDGLLYLSGLDVTTVAQAAARRYELAVDTMLRDGGTLDVAAGDTLVLSHPVGSLATAKPIVKTGVGTLELASANLFANTFISSNGYLNVKCDNCFGSGAVKLCGNSATNTFYGVTLPNAIEILDTSSTQVQMKLVDYTTNVFNGAITPNYRMNMSVPAHACVCVNGGITKGYLNLAGTGTYVFGGKPLKMTDRTRADSAVKLVFKVAGNAFGNNGIQLYNSGITVRTEVANAFADATALTVNNGVKWDLCGCNQRLKTFESKGANTVLTSEEPAVLTFLAGANATNTVNYAVEGGVSLCQEGAGVLRLTADGGLNRKGDLYLRNGQFEVVGDGRTVRCADLYLNDAQKPAPHGVYGAIGSGAQYETERIVGAGFVRSAGRNPGMLLILR